VKHALAAVCAAAVLLAACGDDAPAKVGLYDRAPVPAVPDRTLAIDPDQAAVAADGLYWAGLVGFEDGERRLLTFRLSQAFFAATCIEELGAEECADDYGTIDEPSRTIEAALTELTDVTVVAESRQNYAVTAEELFALAGAGAASSVAPEGYQYREFPFLVTMRGGTMVDAHQIWVP
jgi:hypothetical protein